MTLKNRASVLFYVASTLLFGSRLANASSFAAYAQGTDDPHAVLRIVGSLESKFDITLNYQFVTRESARPGTAPGAPCVFTMSVPPASIELGKFDVPIPPPVELRGKAGCGAALTPGASYSYTVRGASGSVTGSFMTAPATNGGDGGPSAPIKFLVYGDNRSDDVAHAAVVRSMMEASGDFMIHTGDYVEVGSSAEDWDTFFRIESTLLSRHVLFGAVGNHELIEPEGTRFLTYFGQPANHSDSGSPSSFARVVRWGPLQFFVLNGMDARISSEEHAWLKKALGESQSDPGVVWRFVVLHHGPFASGPHGNNRRLQSNGVVDLMRSGKIDLVFSGHDHIYERGNADGLRYIVTGGGGAPLYPIKSRLSTSKVAEGVHHFIEVEASASKLQLVVRRADGTVLEETSVDKATAGFVGDPASPPVEVPTIKPPSDAASSSKGRDGESSPVPWILGLIAIGGAAYGFRRTRNK